MGGDTAVALASTAQVVGPAVRPIRPRLEFRIWRAPLLPAALAFTVGVVADRLFAPPLYGLLAVAGLALAAFFAAYLGGPRGLSLVYLLFVCAAAGAAYHQLRRDHVSDDDVSHLLEDGPQPVRLRGFLDDEPLVRWHPQNDPLRFQPGEEAPLPSTVAVLEVTECSPGPGWERRSGRVQMVVRGEGPGLHGGDEVEVVGLLIAPAPPANPGERDRRDELLDQGVRAVLLVKDQRDLTRLEAGSEWSVTAWRARVRGWGVTTLREYLGDERGGLASALLLGEGGAVPGEEWERYRRTGVMHVLVISGQHLAVLAWFLWLVLTAAGLRQRTGVAWVLAVLWAYVAVAGFRPSLVRAAVAVSVFGGGLLLRRPVILANAFAAAWLVVLAINPMDVNNTGCLLSFLCVAALYWNQGRQVEKTDEVDPLEQMLDQARPAWQRGLRSLGRWVATAYLLTLVLWLVVNPLLVSRLHFVPVAALLIGPPVVLLTSIALVSGFLLLLFSLAFPPAAWVCAWLTGWTLGLSDWLVGLADGVWTSQGYVGDVPGWWLIGWYLLIASGLLLRRRWRRWQSLALAGLAWLVVGLVSGLLRLRVDELRVTFLAVGHGGCTVLETPDGRTLLYDAGSVRGPGVATQQVAPYLWYRGIHRLDEVFLSHADLDHYNGLRQLLDRFAVGRVTLTPSFADKRNPSVAYVLDLLQKRGVPVRVARDGDRFAAGEVLIDVLHPPAAGPVGPENVRSMVLLVRHAGHRLLLTGDLEGEGLARFVRERAGPVDVLMAPHHGSRRLDAKGLMGKTKPAAVVSSQARPATRPPEADPYESGGARFLPTWRHGAVTFRSHASGLVVETFLTRERFVLRAGR